MGLLGDLFDDVIDIAATPFKLGGKVLDDFLETDIEDWVNDTKASVQINKGKCPKCGLKMIREDGFYACINCEHIIKV